MLRKLVVGTAIVAGSFAISAPAMAASSPTFAGVYPDTQAAKEACYDGIDQGRWNLCTMEFTDGGQVELWVA